MRIVRWSLVVLACVAVAGGGLYLTRPYWQGSADVHDDEHGGALLEKGEEAQVCKVGSQARKNLGLTAKPIALTDYWQTILVPGVIVDRPGHSDRGVTAPAVGVVSKIHAFPGDTVKPGDRLFTLRLISEYLQNTQSELFKATRELQLAQEKLDRLLELAKTVTVPEPTKIDAESQVRRFKTAIQGYQQDLLTRGLAPTQIAAVAQGKFVSEIDVVAPEPVPGDRKLLDAKDPARSEPGSPALAYEIQELSTQLGQQVQAGQTLAVLANHQSLYIEGHSFRREAANLERAARQGWPIRVEFVEDDDASWPPLAQTFHIRHLANTIDAASRTFDFFIPLTNQSRAYKKDGSTFLVWRFRPGQRVRLYVPVEQFKDAIVVPTAAVVREGPDVFVFRQNGDLFERRPVHLLYEDRQNVVLRDDGSVRSDVDYVAQSAAASLNRILKAQNTSGGLPPGAHFHADGSLHVPGK